MEPLSFSPYLQKRVWGGTLLRDLYHRELPGDAQYGESWEISDRPEGRSVLRNGPWKGLPLDRLVQPDIVESWLGTGFKGASQFPILVKLLDARETLSLQVHPPLEAAEALGGEPKTEMWYFLHCTPEASIYAGLKAPVSPEAFRQAIESGTLGPLLHEIPVRPGDAIFIPSGRLHAIKAGSVLLEIQENSNTTYRVYDWGRADSDGRPRQLHVDQAIASIDFEDVTPALVPPDRDPQRRRLLARCNAFKAWEYELRGPLQAETREDRFEILCCTQGRLQLTWTSGQESLEPGAIRLLPANLGAFSLCPDNGSAVAVRVFPEPLTPH